MISIYHTQFFESLCNQLPLGVGVLHNPTASLIYVNSLAKEQYLCRLPMSLSEFMVTKLLINEAEALRLEEDVKQGKTIKKSLIPDAEKSNWAQLVVEPMRDNHEYAIMYLSDLSAAAKSEEILLNDWIIHGDVVEDFIIK